MKTNISNTLLAGLLPFCTVIAQGSGKVWDASRDAYVLARTEFADPKAANQAIRQVLAENLKANPKTTGSYLGTLANLETRAKKTPEEIAGLSMGQATDILYPKAKKPGEEGYVEEQAKKAKERQDAVIAKREAEEREEAERIAGDPRAVLLASIAAKLKGLELEALELVGAEIDSAIASLTAPAQEVKKAA